MKYRREVLKPAPIGMSILSESGQLLKNLAVNGFRYATGSLRSTHDFIIDGFVDSIINSWNRRFLPRTAANRFVFKI